MGLTVAVALFGTLAWSFLDSSGRDRGRSASGSSASTSASTSPSPRSSDASTAGGDGAEAADDRGEGAEGREAGGAGPAADASAGAGSSQPVAYPMQWLDAKTSLSVDEPVRRTNRKGDIRLVCGETTCSLESNTIRMAMLYGKPGATLDSCRAALEDPDGRSLGLAAAAAGSEICIGHPCGDIALFVVQVKSTALPQSGDSFVTGDMTVWRGAGRTAG